MSLTRRIAHNTIIQFVSKLIAVGLGVVTIGYMARYLGQVGFGIYATITAYLQFFGILVDFGLQLTMVNLMSKEGADEEKIFQNAFTLRVLSALCFFVLAPIIVLFLPYEAAIKEGVLILTLNFFALAIHQLMMGLFQKHLRMDRAAIAEIAGRLILLCGVLAAIFLDMGLPGILWAVVIATLVQVGMLLSFARKLITIRFRFEWPIWQKIIIDSWPIAISIAFNLIYFKADTLILSLIRTQAEVGIYAAPYRVLEILTSFPFLFVGLLFPLMAKAWSSNDRESYGNFFQKTFDALVIMAIPLVAGTLPLAERLMVLIAGPDFAASGIVLQIIIFATAIIFVNVVFGYSIVVLNKQRALVWGYVGTAVIALTLYLIFIPHFSYIAAAVITVFSELLIFAINAIVSVRTSGYFPKLGIFGKALIASVVMAIVIKFTASLPLALIVLEGVAVYFALMLLMGAIKLSTIREILAIKS